MKPERVADLIEKLVDEKMKLSTIMNSKTLGANKTMFLDDCRKKVEQVKAELLQALKDGA